MQITAVAQVQAILTAVIQTSHVLQHSVRASTDIQLAMLRRHSIGVPGMHLLESLLVLLQYLKAAEHRLSTLKWSRYQWVSPTIVMPTRRSDGTDRRLSPSSLRCHPGKPLSSPTLLNGRTLVPPSLCLEEQPMSASLPNHSIYHPGCPTSLST